MDKSLFHLINEQWTHPALDLFMATIGNVDIWMPLIVLFVLYALIFGGFKGRALIFCIVLALLVNSSLTNSLKKLVDRRRPKQVERVRMVELAKARPKFLTLFKPVEDPLFGRTRSRTLRTFFSFRTRDDEHDDRRDPGPFFPALGLALFFVRRRHRLVAGLPRRALAERRARDFFSGPG